MDGNVSKFPKAVAPAQAASKSNLPPTFDSERVLKEVVVAVSSLSESVDRLMSKIGIIEKRTAADRRFSMSHAGGGSEATSAGDFQDGASVLKKIKVIRESSNLSFKSFDNIGFLHNQFWTFKLRNF